jgi:hypothetical protein
MAENGGGKEKKDNRGPSTANQVERWVEQAETKVFANRGCYKKVFHHATSPKSLAPDTSSHAFRNHVFTLCKFCEKVQISQLLC